MFVATLLHFCHVLVNVSRVGELRDSAVHTALIVDKNPRESKLKDNFKWDHILNSVHWMLHNWICSSRKTILLNYVIGNHCSEVSMDIMLILNLPSLASSMALPFANVYRLCHKRSSLPFAR